MNQFKYLILIIFLVSCNSSNTIYKKPNDLIPKDTMVALLTDMYIASSAKNLKNKFLTKEDNYVFLVYEKYKIDTVRFDRSNNYYTSKADEYSDMLKIVKATIDSLNKKYTKEQRIHDSLNRPNPEMFIDEKHRKLDSIKPIVAPENVR